MFPHDKLDWNLSRLEQRLETARDDALARLEFATACLSKARYHDGGELWFNKALTQARRILQADPSNPGALAVAGASLVGLGRVESATRYLDEALKLAPERPEVHLALGQCHREAGDRHAAVRETEIACRLAPDRWEPHYHLGKLLAERASELGAPRRLLERSQFHTVRALRLDPSPVLIPEMLDQLGVMCLHTGRYADALKLFTRLQEHDAFREKAGYYLGLVSYHLGRYKNAILHHRRYLERHPDYAHVHARIGMSYLHLGEAAKAREACNLALALEPGDLQARWTLGSALLEEGQEEEAVRLFREILQDAPDHLPAFAELVRLRKERGDTAWILKALRTEVSGHDRLPTRDRREHPTGHRMVEIDPRDATRRRVGNLLEALSASTEDTSGELLEIMDLTTSEGLRFQLWEATLAQMASRRARKALSHLDQPGKHFSAEAGREVLTLAGFLPEKLLVKGLQIGEEDLKRAAVDRHGPAHDVGSHRANIDAERHEARAWQGLLLLAVAEQRSRTARNLLVRWASDADDELGDAARVALSVMGDRSVQPRLAERAGERGASRRLGALLAAVDTPDKRQSPRPVSDDPSLVCATCGRRAPEVDHLMAGPDLAVCNQCLTDVARNRRELHSHDASLVCALSGKTAHETEALYVYRGIPIAAEIVDESLGLVEREEVDRYLSTL